MTLNKLLPSAIAISLTSAVYVFAAQYLSISAIWLPFISWSLYFITGCKKSLIPKLVFGLVGGGFIGYLTVIATGPVSSLIGTTLALPVVVFFLVLVILLTELSKPIDMVPAYFFSYSAYFAYFFGGFGGDKATPAGILPLFILLLITGIALGYFTSELRAKLTPAK